MRYRDIMECTTSGSVASVAKSVNSKDAIGVGFDPDGDFGVYDFKKNKKKTEESEEKPIIIKRKMS